MKPNFSIILLSALIIACSSKIGSNITSRQTPLAENEVVLVIDESEVFNNNGIKIGTIKSSDNGFSTNCGYDETIESLKKECRQNGGNIIKITKHKSPDQWSSCDRIEAEIYKVPDYRIYEKEIEWSEDRKLTWNDFKKNTKDIYSPFGAETNCGFGFKSNSVKIFSKTKIFVKNIFNCNLSWVYPKNKNNSKLLDHEQLHFDLCEVYSRQLRKKLTEKKSNYFNLIKDSNEIFNETYALYNDRQKIYDEESKHGTDSIAQKRWKKDIENELTELKAYSTN